MAMNAVFSKRTSDVWLITASRLCMQAQETKTAGLSWAPCARKESLPFPAIMTSITLYARTEARATSDDEVSFHTVSTVFHVFSIEASVLLYNCSWAECRWDMDGNKDRSSTCVYGPMKGSR
jgi:hypothetical protein